MFHTHRVDIDWAPFCVQYFILSIWTEWGRFCTDLDLRLCVRSRCTDRRHHAQFEKTHIITNNIGVSTVHTVSKIRLVHTASMISIPTRQRVYHTLFNISLNSQLLPVHNAHRKIMSPETALCQSWNNHINNSTEKTRIVFEQKYQQYGQFTTGQKNNGRETKTIGNFWHGPISWSSIFQGPWRK